MKTKKKKSTNLFFVIHRHPYSLGNIPPFTSLYCGVFTLDHDVLFPFHSPSQHRPPPPPGSLEMLDKIDPPTVVEGYGASVAYTCLIELVRSLSLITDRVLPPEPSAETRPDRWGGGGERGDWGASCPRSPRQRCRQQRAREGGTGGVGGGGGMEVRCGWWLY